MNIGQIFETVLGAAGKELGVKFATPIFDGATLDDLCEWTDKAGLPRYCSTQLYDGETGEKFDQLATVGIVVGRSKAYEAIVKGEPMPTPGIPESLNVLLHELRGLGLSITLE